MTARLEGHPCYGKLTSQGFLRMNHRTVVALLLLPPLALNLTGCWPQPKYEPMSIRRDGAALVVTFCASIEPNRVEMAQAKPGGVLAFRTFWDFDPSVGFEKGDSISTDPLVTPAFPGERERENPDLRPGDQIGVNASIDAPEGGIPLASSVWVVGPEGLSETLWQHPDGSQSAEPCSE